ANVQSRPVVNIVRTKVLRHLLSPTREQKRKFQQYCPPRRHSKIKNIPVDVDDRFKFCLLKDSMGNYFSQVNTVRSYVGSSQNKSGQVK
ncbi:unnamed protein product, partial [Tenebrio molitor]